VLRCTAVDTLKTLQDGGAFLELRASRTALAAALAGDDLEPDEVPYVEDLAARIDAALTPYFD